MLYNFDCNNRKNFLLASLSEIESKRLESFLNLVQLPLDKALYEASEKIEWVYFPNTALISLVATLENGATSEVSLIGLNGFTGLPVILSSGYSNYRTVVQVAGSAIKVSARILKREFERGGELHRLLHHYTETRLNEIAQLAVCNAHHTIVKRFARQLLMTSDLTASNKIYLTQESLGNMLGVRRAGITNAAQTLQKAGIIDYNRGKIIILNRERLENAACECYQIFRKNFYFFHQKQGDRNSALRRTNLPTIANYSVVKRRSNL